MILKVDKVFQFQGIIKLKLRRQWLGDALHFGLTELNGSIRAKQTVRFDSHEWSSFYLVQFNSCYCFAEK